MKFEPNKLYWFIGAGAVLAMICTSLIYAVNIPYFDDYNLVLDFLRRFKESDTLGQKLSLIWEPRNGHRIVFFRLMTLLDWSLFGAVSFIHLILIANLGWLAVIYLVSGFYSGESKLTQWGLIPLLLMAVPEWAVLNWSASGLTGIWMVLFSLSSFYYLSKRTDLGFVLALFAAILASISFGGGLLVFMAGIPLLLNLDRRKVITWTTIFVLCSISYLWGVSSGSESDSPLTIMLSSPHIVAANTLLFFGAPFKVIYGDQHFWGLIFGLAILAGSTWMLLQSKLRSNRPLVYSGLLFLVLLGVVTAIMRSQFGLGATTAYRYRFFQILPLVFLFLGWKEINMSRIKSLLPALVIMTLVFFGLRYFDNLDRLQFLRHRLEMGLLSLQVADRPDQLSFRVPSQADPIYEHAVEAGVYNPPDWSSFYQPLGEFEMPSGDIPVRLIIHEKIENEDVIELRGMAFPEHSMFGDLQIMGVVRTGEKQILVPTGPYTHPSALIEQNPTAFVLTIPRAFFDGSVELEGIALYHPIKGVVGVVKVPE